MRGRGKKKQKQQPLYKDAHDSVFVLSPTFITFGLNPVREEVFS